MNASPQESDLPSANIRVKSRSASLIWLVPILAAVVAGYLIYQRIQAFGPTITIQFRDVTGIKPGQTPLQYRGAEIGQVTSVALSPDRQSVTVRVKLRRHAESVAKGDSVFWIVRPQVGLGNITGLGTIITGPYVDVLPGSGQAATKFTGVERSPIVIDPEGLAITLHSDHSGSLRGGVPVYYRGIEVGTVRETRLNTNATSVEIHCIIRHRYAPLVRPESKFWNVTGVDVRVGLFRGAEVNIESLKSLVIGGIAFATPAGVSAGPVAAGLPFILHDQAEKDWLKWAPRIPLPPDGASLEQGERDAARNVDFAPRSIR